MAVLRVVLPHAPNPASDALYPEGDVFDSLDPDEGGGGSSVQKALWLLVGLSAIFLALRLYCKQTYASSRLRWEDAVLVASWVSGTMVPWHDACPSLSLSPFRLYICFMDPALR